MILQEEANYQAPADPDLSDIPSLDDCKTPQTKPRLRKRLSKEEWQALYPQRHQPKRGAARISTVKLHKRVFNEQQQCFYYLPTSSSYDDSTYKLSTTQARFALRKNRPTVRPDDLLQQHHPNPKIQVLQQLTQSFYDKNYEFYKSPFHLPYHHQPKIIKEAALLFRND